MKHQSELGVWSAHVKDEVRTKWAFWVHKYADKAVYRRWHHRSTAAYSKDRRRTLVQRQRVQRQRHRWAMMSQSRRTETMRTILTLKNIHRQHIQRQYDKKHFTVVCGVYTYNILHESSEWHWHRGMFNISEQHVVEQCQPTVHSCLGVSSCLHNYKRTFISVCLL